MKPYQMTEEQIVQLYNTHPQHGLTNDYVAHQRAHFGYNSLPHKAPDSWIKIFLLQFQNPLIYILVVASAIIFLAGQDRFDAFIITGILLFNALIGTLQEGRAGRLLAGLKDLVTTECTIVRNGTNLIIDSKELVPGDLVILKEGQRVPADIRLLFVNGLLVDESVLTGESTPVTKETTIVLKPDAPVMDQHNMVFNGTYILAGIGTGIVVAIGSKTEFGQLHIAAEEIQTDMPLKRDLNRLSVWIVIFTLAICSILFIAGLMTEKPLQELLVTLTALFICVVPEGLPVVLTLVLVSGVHKMAKLGVLVKKMQAIEALGRIDVIVIDKTGTLTRNEMMVQKVFAENTTLCVTGQGYSSSGGLFIDNIPLTDLSSHPELVTMAKALLLLNNAKLSKSTKTDCYKVKGDPTEAALAVLAYKLNLSETEVHKEYEKIDEIPFNPQLKYHAIVCKKDNSYTIFIAGAPETLLQWSTNVDIKLKNALASFLSQGLRVVAVGSKTGALDNLPEGQSSSQERIDTLKQVITSNIHILGLCGIQDAIRQEVASVITDARAAGIHIIMATGDHQKTAQYVAKEVGIFQQGDMMVDGLSLQSMPQELLVESLKFITVFSRVSPVHKLNIIRAFHDAGHVVAMTGDGVNDVPSLLTADIGIAMGRIGTEVAKEAADIVLLDDSFVHIITAIKQGRHIFYTLRRIILYFFATNLGEILIMLFSLVLYFFDPYFPLPLSAVQILWLNLITDGFLNMALSFEPYEHGLLEKTKITHNKSIIDASLFIKALIMSLPMAIGSLIIFFIYYPYDIIHARTMTLLTMAMFQWFNAWNCRSEDKSILSLGIFTNRALIFATFFVLILQICILYIPFMQNIFKVQPLSFVDWVVVISISSSIVIVEEAIKFLKNKLSMSKQL